MRRGFYVYVSVDEMSSQFMDIKYSWDTDCVNLSWDFLLMLALGEWTPAN